MATERFVFDAVAAALMLATALAGAWLPKYLGAGRPHNSGHLPHSHIDPGRSTAFQLGNMLSAGVMLSAGFCHLLADALHNQELAFNGRFPMATFLAALGFLVTLVSDQIVQAIAEAAAAAPAAPAAGDKLTYSDATAYMAIEMTDSAAPVLGSSANGMRRGRGHAAAADAVPLMAGARSSEDGILTTAVVLAPPVGASSSSPTAGRHRHPLHPHAPGHPLSPRHASHAAPLPLPGAVAPPAHDHAAAVAALAGGRKMSFATAVLLAAALCVHSVLEGMALGSQDNMKDTEDIFIAIIAHKGLAAYALGGSVVESGADDRRFWTLIALFSSATPLGIFLGYSVSAASHGVGGAALSALASGTFLYVAMMEVIPKELADGHNRVWKMLMLVLGFGAMSLLAVWA